MLPGNYQQWFITSNGAWLGDELNHCFCQPTINHSILITLHNHRQLQGRQPHWFWKQTAPASAGRFFGHATRQFQRLHFDEFQLSAITSCQSLEIIEKWWGNYQPLVWPVTVHHTAFWRTISSLSCLASVWWPVARTIDHGQQTWSVINHRSPSGNHPASRSLSITNQYC